MSHTKELNVPLTAMVEVATMIDQRELDVTIQGPHYENGDTIVIEVHYDRDDREAVHELEDFIEDAWAELEDDDEEDDDDDDDEEDDDEEDDDDDEDDDD